MMSQGVQGSRREQVIVEDLRPLLESAVGSDQDRAALIALTDDLVQVLDGRWGQDLQAEIVQD